MFKVLNPITMYDAPKTKTIVKTGRTLTMIGEIAVPRKKRKQETLANGEKRWFDTYEGYLDIEGPDGQVFSILVGTFGGKVEILKPREESVEVVAGTPAGRSGF